MDQENPVLLILITFALFNEHTRKSHKNLLTREWMDMLLMKQARLLF